MPNVMYQLYILLMMLFDVILVMLTLYQVKIQSKSQSKTEEIAARLNLVYLRNCLIALACLMVAIICNLVEANIGFVSLFLV